MKTTIPTIRTKNDLSRFLKSKLPSSDNKVLLSELGKNGFITNSKGKVQPIKN